MDVNIFTIDEIKSIVTPIAQKHQIDALYLFGSYAKGEATPDSDVDFLMDTKVTQSLSEFSAFRLELEEALDKPVDLLTLNRNDQKVIKKLLQTAVLIYGSENKSE